MAHQDAHIGVILNGGGLGGLAAHTGFMQALAALDVDIVAALGSSTGAVVAGALASGRPLDDLAAAIHALEPSQLWSPGTVPALIWRLMVNHGRGQLGLSDSRRAMEWCRQQLLVDRFEQCQWPFYALARNLSNNRNTLFTQGELLSAVVASAAMPFCLQPVRIEDQYYCDGAQVELQATEAICCTQDLDALIIHHAVPEQTTPQRFEKNLSQAWPLYGLVENLVYNRRPWYVGSDRLSLHACPYKCKAVIVAIESSVPRIQFSGPADETLESHMQNVRKELVALLTPYANRLRLEPHRFLPVADSGRAP